MIARQEPFTIPNLGAVWHAQVTMPLSLTPFVEEQVRRLKWLSPRYAQSTWVQLPPRVDSNLTLTYNGSDEQ